MFRHLLIGVLFYTVLFWKESFGADDSISSLADQLNAILSYPGWKRITDVRAKYRLAVNGNESFTSKDLFVSDNLFIDNGKSVNTLVGVDNENVKLYMVTHLVGCVYANATLKFAVILRNILEDVTRTRKNLRNQVDYRRKRKSSDGAEKEEETLVDESPEWSEAKSVNSNDKPINDKLVDLKVPWAIFNFALLQLANSSSMFDRMFSAMRYLIDTIPSGEPFDVYTRYMLDIHAVSCLKLFKDVSKNINLVLPMYIGEQDPDYNNTLGALSSKFIRFLDGQANTVMQPFLDDYCIVSEMARPNFKTQIRLLKVKYGKIPTSTDMAYQFGAEIRRLVHEVCIGYYSELGFEYDDCKQTTSFPKPPTQ